MDSSQNVPKLYHSVVDDVITNVREYFLDDGVDEQVLLELKQLWENKLQQSKVLRQVAQPQPLVVRPQVVQRPQIIQQTITAQQQQQHQQTQQQATFQQQMPVLNTSHGLLEMSGAAQAATIALPPGIYQQHLAGLQGQAILGPGGTQYIIQTTPAHLLQARTAAGQQPQAFTVNSTQPTTDTQAIQQMVQLDGPVESSATCPNKMDADVSSCSASAASSAASSSVDKCHNSSKLKTKSSGKSKNKRRMCKGTVVVTLQLDGTNDSSSDDDDDGDDKDEDDDDDDDDQNDEDNDEGEDEEPLNSADDVSSEEDPAEVFDTESVVVCQFDKINRNKNKWKFHLKDGIMNLNGTDHVFQKATGEAEW